MVVVCRCDGGKYEMRGRSCVDRNSLPSSKCIYVLASNVNKCSTKSRTTGAMTRSVQTCVRGGCARAGVPGVVGRTVACSGSRLVLGHLDVKTREVNYILTLLIIAGRCTCVS